MRSIGALTLCEDTDMRKRTRLERVYVKVNSDFDATGYVQPRTIVWKDGRIFLIQEVRDFRPASSMGAGKSGDCYTIIIDGQEKFLYFERTDPMFHGRVGRWFVEKTVELSD